MTKTELVSIVAKQVEGVTKKTVAEITDIIFNEITSALEKQEKVQIVSFGTFEVQERAARKGRNPQNPDTVIEIPAKTVAVFRAGKGLKEKVNK